MLPRVLHGRVDWAHTEGTCKLLRELRKESLTHVRELWLVGMDRRHAAENTLARNTSREQWLNLQRTLGRTKNRQNKLMPDWATVKTKPLCSIRLSLARWLKVRRRNVASGGQLSITGFIDRRPHVRPPQAPCRRISRHGSRG